MRSLIVTADDFGAAAAVNEAVECAHRRGILTCASLMVSAPAAADAVKRAKAMPTLGVGLHLVLVEGRPTLAASEIPDLVDGDGFFRCDMAKLGAEIFFRPKVRRQLAHEIAAQFKAFAATGLALDHVNAHKHYHLHPTIAALTLRIGAAYGLKAMRVPYEPAAVLRRVEADAPGNALVAWWARQLGHRLDAAGIFHPDQTFGLAWSGAMTEARLCGLLENLPDGVSEIYFHPAQAAAYTQSAPGYAYEAEAAALVSPQVFELTKKLDIAGAPFAAFHDPA
jgi:chitin disaccharide deacetylase